MNNREQWLKALDFIRFINKAGFDAFIVGGAVRDFFLNRPIHDFDIVTNASECDMQQLFTRVITPTRRFETWIVPWKNLAFEVTPYRSNSKQLIEDVTLRDFTMNALAADKTGAIIDPLEGKKDINTRVIRSYLPVKRLEEDPLRIMRAMRFVSQLGFIIETDTWLACLSQQSLLEIVPVERMQAEMDKLLMGFKHEDALYFMFHHCFPLYFPKKVRPQRTIDTRKHYNMNSLLSNSERWAAFLWLMYQTNADQYMKQWVLPKNEGKKIRYMLQMCHSYPEGVLWDQMSIYEAGETLALQTERVHQWVRDRESKETLQYISHLYDSLPIKSRKDLMINGKDVIELFPLMKKKK
ncbi:hypothetical protein D7Z54_10755 [Salibacterium salarium]|uniref:tRNA nucleotidyltransferase (CCA-adding enzyme) n=1 Tax=Salibacterium salarium TaxID=284579 RepID=A0A3R9PLH1_9BACI|nr:hypothetical protein [Salibacterium salarium]RSL33438.1 hypothetical protein D7Z54_10755 [Salibacterium salarium]